jgi:flagellar protein FliO/FliZ
MSFSNASCPARWPAAARRAAAALILAAHASARAQAALPAPLPGPAHPVEGPSFLPMAVALLLVLGLLAAAVWVLRRTGIAPRAGGGHLRLVSQLPLGPRERVVIVEVADRWLVLGVGSGGISRLGSVPKSDAGAAPAPAAAFGTLLEKLRGGRP